VPVKRAANFERRQEWSAALSPESFLGGAASLRWCVAFRLRWRSGSSFQAFRRSLEVFNNETGAKTVFIGGIAP